jgi:tRNA(His) 5'-end guanylyltransferase
MKDDFGNRMKLFEGVEAKRKAMPLLPILVRLDGKCFSRWTRGLRKPYDGRLSDIMTEVTRVLVHETNARIGFTQSDEISLVLYSGSFKSQVFCDGRIQKLVSIIASIATAQFNKTAAIRLPSHSDRRALFDCRVWTVPTQIEATNAVLWRERDATKNSIYTAAREFYSHKQLYGKNGGDMQEMLFQKGVNWNDYPAFFKRGVFVQRHKIVRKFSREELEKLPSEHQARRDPDLEVERTEIRVVEMPPFGKVINRVEVVFEGEDPKLLWEEEV